MEYKDVLQWVSASSALLWLPFLWGIWKKKQPKEIYISFDKQINIGFDLSGSVLTTRLAMCTADDSDIIFEEFNMELINPDNTLIYFNINRMEDTITTKIVYDTSKESISSIRVCSDILIFLKAGQVLDKYVFCNTKKDQENRNMRWKELMTNLSHFKSSGKSGLDILKTQELATFITDTKSLFIWKAGRYKCSFIANSKNKKIVLKNNIFSFTLTSKNIEDIENNKNLIKSFFDNFYAQPNDKKEFIFPVLPVDIYRESHDTE